MPLPWRILVSKYPGDVKFYMMYGLGFYLHASKPFKIPFYPNRQFPSRCYQELPTTAPRA